MIDIADAIQAENGRSTQKFCCAFSKIILARLTDFDDLIAINKSRNPIEARIEAHLFRHAATILDRRPVVSVSQQCASFHRTSRGTAAPSSAAGSDDLHRVGAVFSTSAKSNFKNVVRLESLSPPGL
jgi:hypothetical protein